MTNCKNCGAPISFGSTCAYCGTIVNNAYYPLRMSYMNRTIDVYKREKDMKCNGNFAICMDTSMFYADNDGKMIPLMTEQELMCDPKLLIR